jgi:hypothetical protein
MEGSSPLGCINLDTFTGSHVDRLLMAGPREQAIEAAMGENWTLHLNPPRKKAAPRSQ